MYQIISYNFLDLVHKLLIRTRNISDMRHSDFFSSNWHNQHCRKFHSIRSNCAFTTTEAVLIDVYVFNSSPLLLLKSVVWCRRTKNLCERHVPDPTSLSGLPLRESILNCDRNWFRTVLKYE